MFSRIWNFLQNCIEDEAETWQTVGHDPFPFVDMMMTSLKGVPVFIQILLVMYSQIDRYVDHHASIEKSVIQIISQYSYAHDFLYLKFQIKQCYFWKPSSAMWVVLRYIYIKSGNPFSLVTNISLLDTSQGYWLTLD